MFNKFLFYFVFLGRFTLGRQAQSNRARISKPARCSTTQAGKIKIKGVVTFGGTGGFLS